MTHGRGARIEEFRAPLFLAWQLTNRCAGNCLHCCEESGPDKAWRGELTKEESLSLARQTVAEQISYASFGGGEPLSVPHVWEVFEVLSQGGVSLKIETDGLLIDEPAVERLKGLAVSSVQISVDGAKAETHARLRPGGSFAKATKCLERLAQAGLGPEFVFVPSKQNVSEIGDAYDLAASLGCRVFVTGPMMRLGRAAAAWADLGLSQAEWKRAEAELSDRAAKRGTPVRLAVYPWDIQHEIKTRAESPQAMVLVVPDGKVKLLNALPFAPGDMRKDTLAQAWEKVKAAWRSPEVLEFCRKAADDPALLRHANETWPVSDDGQRSAIAV